MPAKCAAPQWFVHVCPHCGKQYKGPSGHRMAGDDRATSCHHARPGERGISQPRLVSVRVQPVEPFVPLAIPHDRPLVMADGEDE